MSGIAGVIRFDEAPVAVGLVERMTGAMAHRGPDGVQHWARGAVALGQCVMRTTPESLEEHLPLGNEDDSVVLVMDGRVDNWEELRRDLIIGGRSCARALTPSWCCGRTRPGAAITCRGSKATSRW